MPQKEEKKKKRSRLLLSEGKKVASSKLYSLFRSLRKGESFSFYQKEEKRKSAQGLVREKSSRSEILRERRKVFISPKKNSHPFRRKKEWSPTRGGETRASLHANAAPVVPRKKREGESFNAQEPKGGRISILLEKKSAVLLKKKKKKPALRRERKRVVRDSPKKKRATRIPWEEKKIVLSLGEKEERLLAITAQHAISFEKRGGRRGPPKREGGGIKKGASS